jgi:hypothetical protein
MGCRRFLNYKHLVSVTKDGLFISSGEFLVSLGTYTTIPKAPGIVPIDRTIYKYLDIVHHEIVFGNCIFVGQFKYALKLVNCATCYNWCSGLKSLQFDNILAAFMAF